MAAFDVISYAQGDGWNCSWEFTLLLRSGQFHESYWFENMLFPMFIFYLLEFVAIDLFIIHLGLHEIQIVKIVLGLMKFISPLSFVALMAFS